MKRFNLLHKSNWEQLRRCFAGAGCVWFNLPDGWMLISGRFADPNLEHAWNSYPAVIHLHHPVKECTLPLSDLLTEPHAYKRFKQEHLDLLRVAFGADASDTMERLNFKVAAVHPGCTIYTIPKEATLWVN